MRRVFMTIFSILLFSAFVFTGCGNLSKQNKGTDKNAETTTEKEPEQTVTNTFTMDREVRQGFILPEESAKKVSDGYIGIYSVKDFKKIKDNPAGKYMLMEDLDLSDFLWNTIDFSGTIEGNYHVVSGLGKCLFRDFTGSVSNLGFKDVCLDSAAIAILMNRGSIMNCYVTGKVTGNGGFVKSVNTAYSGAINGISIQYCYNAAEISKEDTMDSVGGIVGYMNLSTLLKDSFEVDIYNCENYGVINSSDNAGGIVGSVGRGATGTGYYDGHALDYSISRCFNYGEINGAKNAGGIIGVLSATNASKNIKNIYSIDRCANYGVVTKNKKTDNFEYSGGICGLLSLTANSDYNHMLEVNISDCLNTADIIRPEDFPKSGAICGSIEMKNGICNILRCLDIGKTEGIYCNYTDWSHSSLYTEKECDSSMSIADMKNMEKNLPGYDYPAIWGIDGYFEGFPHPYGVDEEKMVSDYAKEKKDRAAREMVEGTEVEKLILNQHYADVLEGMSFTGYWPEDEEQQNYCSYLSEWSENFQCEYSIFDVNNDGTEELLVKAYDSKYAVYSYDTNAGKAKLEYSCESTQEWEEKYSSSSQIDWVTMKSENYQVYSNAYVAYYSELLEQKAPEDLGFIFLQNEGNLETVEKVLKKEHGVTFKENQDYTKEGKYQGDIVFVTYEEDGGALEYQKKINDVTIFGLYPGMEETKVEETLKQYGLYQGRYSYKLGNCLLSVDAENGVVQSISIRYGSEYAG